MAEIKVSQLPEASEINDNDLIMIVQNNVNKKITKENCKFASGDEVAVSDTEPTGEESDSVKLWINPEETPSGSLNPITNEYSVATDKGYSCNYLNGVVLYKDNSGTTGNITLSDTTANYRYIEIYAVDNDSRTRYFDVFKFDTSSSTFNISSCSASANNFAIFTALYTNNGTTLTNGGHYLYNGSIASYPVIRVMKIIGYK